MTMEKSVLRKFHHKKK